MPEYPCTTLLSIGGPRSLHILPIPPQNTAVCQGNHLAPGGSAGKESTFNVGDLGSTPGLGRSPGGGHGNPLQYSSLENPHGQRSLAGYSP